MHHATKKALVKKYGEMPFETTNALFHAIKNGEELNDEEAQEIVKGIEELKHVPKEEVLKAQPISKEVPGKNLYDKWRGIWNPSKTERVPGTGDVYITEWLFETIEVKANRTGIPLEEKVYRTFNDTHFMPVGKTPTEQLYPAGTKDPIVFAINDQGRFEQIIK